jgi:hypothetical protein
MKRRDLVALLILAAGAVWLVWWLIQPSLSAEVVERGGQLIVEPETSEGPTTSVVFVGRPIGDDDLQFLRGKRGFQRLLLDSTRVTGKSLQNLEGAEELKWLSLMSCPVDDDGLAFLPALRNLELLDLDHTRITNAGLAHVGKQKGLKQLMICRNKTLTDACLDHLKGLDELTELHALDTGITEAGIRRLQKSLPRLQKIYIGKSED